MNNRILVTGGAGFIGSNFVNYMIQNFPNYQITVYDKLTYAGNKKSINSAFFKQNDKYKFIKGCMCDSNTLSQALLDTDYVIHFASESHVTNSLAQANEFVTTNVLGTMVLCEKIIKYKIKKIILISTSEVYGTALSKPMTEEHPLNPASPYAGSKAGQDRIAFSYYYSFNIPIITLRPFNQYGKFQHTEKVIPKFITRLIDDKKITLENNGTQTRDWLFVEDLCRAISIVLQSEDESLFGEVINIGSGMEVSIHEIAATIARILKKDPEKYIICGSDRYGQVASHIASIEKAQKLINWLPKIDFQTGIRQTIQWYVENESWWRNLRFPVLKVPEIGLESDKYT